MFNAWNYLWSPVWLIYKIFCFIVGFITVYSSKIQNSNYFYIFVVNSLPFAWNFCNLLRKMLKIYFIYMHLRFDTCGLLVI